jgi:hypothetical protein
MPILHDHPQRQGRVMAVRFFKWMHALVLKPMFGVSVPVQKAVLGAYVDHANDEGRTWPGIKLIVTETGWSRATVIAATNALAAQGAIVSVSGRRGGTDEGGRGISNVWMLGRCAAAQGSSTQTPKGPAPRPPRVQLTATKDPADCDQGSSSWTRSVLEPSIDPSLSLSLRDGFNRGGAPLS